MSGRAALGARTSGTTAIAAPRPAAARTTATRTAAAGTTAPRTAPARPATTAARVGSPGTTAGAWTRLSEARPTGTTAAARSSSASSAGAAPRTTSGASPRPLALTWRRRRPATAGPLAVALVGRGAGHHPAWTGGRNFPRRRTAVEAAAVAIARATSSGAARTAGSSGTAGATRAAGTATRASATIAAPAAVAATSASTPVVATAAPVIEPALLRVRGHVRHVVVLADLAGVRGRIFTLHDPDEANVVDPVFHRVEGLEQAREPLLLDPHLLFDLGARSRISRHDGRIDLGLRRRRGCGRLSILCARAFCDARAFATRLLGAALRAARGFGALARLALRGRRDRRILGRRRRLIVGPRRLSDQLRRHARRLGSSRGVGSSALRHLALAGRLGRIRRRRRRRSGLRARRNLREVSFANARGIAQQRAGELGEGLHGNFPALPIRRPSPESTPAPFVSPYSLADRRRA